MSKQAEGGKARAAKLSADERRAIAKQGAVARWSVDASPDTPKATHSGVLCIGDQKIPCAVLADETRVISESGLTGAILGSRSGASKRLKAAHELEGKNEGALLPLFLAPSNLNAHIPQDLLDGPLKPITYSVGNRLVRGFNAKALPIVCDVWLKARESGDLQRQQYGKAMKAEILMRGLAHVGITSLVDEATGYQADRDRDALQKLLEVYLVDERLRWAQRFPQEFFDHLFRLNGWPKPIDKSKRPRIMGKIINKIVYEQLPEGVLSELRKKNPAVPESGRRKYKHHQFLSEDIGQKDLQSHILQLLTIMRLSGSWSDFQGFFTKVFHPDAGLQQELDFGDEE